MIEQRAMEESAEAPVWRETQNTGHTNQKSPNYDSEKSVPSMGSSLHDEAQKSGDMLRSIGSGDISRLWLHPDSPGSMWNIWMNFDMQEPPRHGFLANFASSKLFEIVSALVIVGKHHHDSVRFCVRSRGPSRDTNTKSTVTVM